MSTRMMMTTVKRQGWRAAVLATAVVMTAVMGSRPHASNSVVVVAVPWQGSEAKPHPVTQNGTVVLQAVASNAGDGNAISLMGATWDPGDGSGPHSISVSDSRALELEWTYAGAVGTPYTATISVTDADNVVHTDTFKVQVQPNTMDTRVNMAIDRALWYNHKAMVRSTDTPIVTPGVANFVHPAYSEDTVFDQVSPNLKVYRNNGRGLVVPTGIVLSAITPNPVGSPVTFDHPGYWSSLADVISPGLQINRGYGGGLYPQGGDAVLWGAGACTAGMTTYPDFNNMLYNVYRYTGATGYRPVNEALTGATVCLMDLTTKVGYDLTFSSYEVGPYRGGDSGFAYSRVQSVSLVTYQPDVVQWAAGTCAAPATGFYDDHSTLIQNWFRWNGNTGNKPPDQSQLNYPQCMRDVTTGQDYNFMILSFGRGTGDFSYYREGLAGGSAPVYGTPTTFGRWTDTEPNASSSAAIQAFEVNGHRASGSALTDPYVDDVARGLRGLLSHITRVNIDSQGHAGTLADPSADQNGNGYGLQTDGNSIVYVGGQIIDAIVASGTPNALATVGTEAGRKYSDIVQDMIDAYAFGQSDQGGWIYNWNDGGIDASSSGWWGVGQAAAEVWGLSSPQWVKNLNQSSGITTLQDSATGGCGYRSTHQEWGPITETSACMIMLSADGQARTSPQFTAAENYVASRFGVTNSNYPGGTDPYDNIYAMYNLTKAMRLAKDAAGHSAPINLLGGTVDWYAGLSANLVNNQRYDGKLATQNGIGVNDGISNSWGILILSPALFENGPTAVCSTDTAVVCQAGAPVGSGSCNTTGTNPYSIVHFDGSQSTAGDNPISFYSWNFQDGGSTADASTIATQAEFTSTGTFDVQLTVTDTHNISSTASCPVVVTAASLPPIVDAGGPYTMCIGAPSFVLDGTHSIGRGSNIQSYAWDVSTPVDFATINATTAATEQAAFFNSLGLGTHDIGLRITDDANPVNTTTAYTTVTVRDCAPPVITVPANVTEITTNPAGAIITYSAPTVLDNVDGTNDTVTCTSSPNVGLSSGSNFPVGTTTITCNAMDLAGNAATPASFTVTVSNLITSSASATPVNAVYNGAPVVAVAACTPSTLTPQITYSPGPGAPVNAGLTSYTVTCGDGEVQYTTSTATGSILIGTAAVTAQAGSGSSVYDGATHAPSACGVSGAYTGDLSCSNGPAVAGPGVGTTTTTPVVSGTGLSNYSLTSLNGSYAITPADSSIVLNCPASVAYNGAAQEVCTATVTGAGGLNASVPVSYTNNTEVGSAGATATYAGDANHTGSTGTGGFEITRIISSAAAGTVGGVYNGSAYVGSGTCSSPDLTPQITYTPGPGAPVNAGSTSFTVTCGDGGVHYTTSIATGTITIAPADSTTTVSCAASAVYTGSPIQVCTATVTGDGGLSASVPVTYSNNTNVGTAGASASYGGDANHTGSSGSNTFQITAASTGATVTAPTITYAANGAVTVNVTSGAGTPSGNVSLSVDGGAPMTQALSGGSTTFTLASPNAGDHALLAAYAAQGNFQAAQATGNLHVNQSPTATTLTSSPSPQAAGQAVTLTATVVAVAPGSGVPNGTVTFKDGATVIGTATVNGAGVATIAPTTLAIGPHTITATYSGSSNYIASAAGAVSQLIYGYPTGGGTFVIGDNNAVLGKAVNFWGSQWEKTNSLTGGPSNASFKGFAIAPAPAVVGATFTGAPGGSAPPPTAVPQYLGVIVTSKVTKSGSTITGTIVKVVVVRVDPGYAGDPGHNGNGTIVAILP